MNNINALYDLWLKETKGEPELYTELKSMDDTKKEDAFYRDLAFGTGGLRGVIGAGTNRMNVFTVAKASQGLATYVVNTFKPEERRIAISRDSRNNSDVFSKVAAEVFAGNGIKVMIYPDISPVPTLSFATRYLHCAAGVMITASHNPAKYNGYKVTGPDGCQITDEGAKAVLKNIEATDTFHGVKRMSWDEGFEKGLISYIPPKVLTAFIENVKAQSLVGDEEIDKDVAIVYTPLNGTGLIPVTRALREMGYTNVTVVKEQKPADGNFPTCPFPNPEIKEAMALGMEYAKKYNADLLIATDPDCDREGIAIKDQNGEYQLISGNLTGCLLFNYICERRVALHKMPKDPIMVKTIVTTDLAKKIADHYGVKTINCLTGFKYIGEQISLLEKEGHPERYIFGFEESYGCLTGTYVRDKDGVNGATLIAEMFAYYKTHGISLFDKLNELYRDYGYTLNTLYSYYFEGASGFDKMQNLMKEIRANTKGFAGHKVIEALDYLPGLNGLPSSNVLQYYLEDDCSVVIRPSGTEPKLKAYVTVADPDEKKARQMEADIAADLSRLMK